MIFITWLSLNGIENRHIKKDLTGLLKCIFYWGKQKGQLTTFCWSFLWIYIALVCGQNLRIRKDLTSQNSKSRTKN